MSKVALKEASLKTWGYFSGEIKSENPTWRRLKDRRTQWNIDPPGYRHSSVGLAPWWNAQDKPSCSTGKHSTLRSQGFSHSKPFLRLVVMCAWMLLLHLPGREVGQDLSRLFSGLHWLIQLLKALGLQSNTLWALVDYNNICQLLIFIWIIVI